MNDTPNDLISTREATTLLPSKRPGRKVHISTILRWVLSGKLRGWRVGGSWFVSRSELLSQVRLVQPRRDDQTAAEAEARERAARTDRVLREKGVR